MDCLKRLLATMLILCVVLGDCGGITVLAAENTAAAEEALSEHPVTDEEILSDEDLTAEDQSENEAETITNDDSIPDNAAGNTESDNADTASETTETDEALKLPSLHIGSITEGESLPSADDDTFHYDFPLSFETSESLTLFTNYAITAMPEGANNGSLEWSILRGEKGLTPGTTVLFMEDDDWAAFEEVSDSPFFTLEEIADSESAYGHMMTLAAKETSFSANDREDYDTQNAAADYDYYIRAAYYPETETGKAAAFYAAATIPFMPLKTDIITETQEDTANNDTLPATDTPDEATVSENSAKAAVDTISGNTPENAASANESDIRNASEDNHSENETEQTTEPFSTLSENSSMSVSSSTPGEEPTPSEQPEHSEVTSITLSETTTLVMQPDGDAGTKQITATVTAETPSLTVPPLLWESSDKTVATVSAGENGTATIKAASEGYAKITASCGGKSASVTVDVVADIGNPDNDKLLDLSNEIRVAGFEKESDALVYTGQKITQNLRVYYKENLLAEKTDYTLTYRNNVNAAAWNTAKAPSVTINLRGQYQGSVTLYYTIKPLDINQIDIYSADNSGSLKTPAYEQTVNFGNNLNLPAPVLNFGKKRLAAKRDFVCDYALLTEELGGKDYKKGSSYEAGKVYHYTVNGTGNFTGSFQMDLVILDNDLKKKNFSNASVTLDKSKYDYCGQPLSTNDVKIKTLKISNVTLAPSFYDYEVCANGIEGASLTVFPTAAARDAGYRGCKKINLRLAGDRKINDKNTVILNENWKEKITFSQQTVDKSGGIFQQGTNLLNYKTDTGAAEPLVEGTDYTIKYGNAKKAGTVTVTFKGMGRYTGSVSYRYQIIPNADGRHLTIIWGKNVTEKGGGTLEIPYQKNGAVPEFYIRDENYVVLNSKTDYSVTLKDNKKPTSVSGKEMTCTIKGKGNYNGYVKTVSLTVTKADISQATLTAADKQHNTRPNQWKSNVIVTDTNGKRLSAGTDYDRTISYTYEGMDPSDPNAVPSADKNVTVTVTGTGFYEGSLTVENAYHIYNKTYDIGKLKIEIDPQTYTGAEIALEKSAIHVYASDADKKANKELADKDNYFQIMGYSNNIKSGNAKVTLHGLAPYGGTKTYTFKILKKNYLINRVKGIAMDKNTLSLSLIDAAENPQAGKLTATITSQTKDPIANSTIIWSSSNRSIADVEGAADGETSGIDSATGAATVSGAATIRAYKEGTVTITATTQDGGKRTQCRVTITNQPVFVEAGQSMKANIGETCQLHLKYVQAENAGTNVAAVWESSNPDAISVDSTGLLTMQRAGASVIKVSVSKYKYTAQCYAIAIDPNEQAPETTGALLTYRQQDGVADDTPYINKILRDYEWGDDTHKREATMYLPAGVYHIDATTGGNDIFGKYKFGGIVLTTNQKLVMSPSALLIALPNSAKNYQIISSFGHDNITISGGQIIGERKEHKNNIGEHGHGIGIFGCTNVTIENLNISECWGDGIYLGFYDGPNIGANGVTIKNCKLHHNRRNNLAITDASNVTVTDCSFNYASGTAPQYGIDIEPNDNRTCSNVRISNSTFWGNAKGTIQILGQKNAHINGVTIENCKGDKAPVQWSGFGGSVKNVTQNGNNWNWNGK